MTKMEILGASIGKKSFTDNKIKENYNAFLFKLLKRKTIWYKR